jgi:PncC family amidohydrolase
MPLEQKVIQNLILKNKTIAAAESCTGGLLSHRLTNVPGSSAAFLGSFVVYQNSVKVNQLNIPASILKNHGAVSRETALIMAINIRKIFGADYGVSATGIAGPGGGSAIKPVGLVWVAFSTPQENIAFELHWKGSRIQNKTATVSFILERLLSL